MQKVEPSEILDLTAYEKVRADFVQTMIERKRPRRIHVGENLCFIFENRDTVIFQIQEMTRAERTVSEEAIAAEVAVYNELVPGDDELSATLMIEIPDRSRVRSELDRLVGIDEHVFMDIGDETIQATFDEKQFEEDRISAVQYVRFALGPELAARFRDSTASVSLRVEHPNYTSSTAIEGRARASLAADLA
ncbi:MAG: DUF3501 family protein [Myxococcales bacterium]|nr:DUF3501 family protein [Myxococcales bacterium]